MLRHIDIMILAVHRISGTSKIMMIGNCRHQTFATEKLLNVEKDPKSYIV